MKRIAALLCSTVLVCSTLLTGCGEAQQSASQSEGGETQSSALQSLGDNVQTALQSEGREYGQSYELNQDEVMSTAFFDLTINSVETADELEENYLEDDTYTFLIMNVTIKNTFKDTDTIPMSDADFPITWAELDGEYAYPDTEFEDTFPAEYEINSGESMTGNLIYIVSKDATDFSLEYYDLWDDEFEGNTYSQKFSVK